MNNELKWGIAGTVIIIILTVIFISQYSDQNNKLQISNPSVNTTQATLVTLTVAEIAKHNQPQDCWIIISNQVYGVSDYLSSHPDGRESIISYCGQDATQAYQTKGGRGKDHSSKADMDLVPLKIGTVNEEVNLPK